MAINEVTSIDVKTLPPFKRLIMTLGELPTSYLESMTYAELLMWFCNFLQEKVLPTIDNNAEALQDVITYLENLDLQDEVNNKLDEMVEDGTLASLLQNYSLITKTYNTYQDLISDTTLVSGMKLKTLGYYDINDGGGAEYIVTSEPLSDTLVIELNDLYINLILKSDLNIEVFGAVGDGTTDDTASFTEAFKYATILHFKNKTYKILGVPVVKNITLIGDSTKFISPARTIESGGYGVLSCLLDSNNDNDTVNPELKEVIIKNITFDGNKQNTSIPINYSSVSGVQDCGVRLLNIKNVIIDNCSFINTIEDGLYTALVENLSITNSSFKNNGTLITGTKNAISCVAYYWYGEGVERSKEEKQFKSININNCNFENTFDEVIRVDSPLAFNFNNNTCINNGRYIIEHIRGQFNNESILNITNNYIENVQSYAFVVDSQHSAYNTKVKFNILNNTIKNIGKHTFQRATSTEQDYACKLIHSDNTNYKVSFNIENNNISTYNDNSIANEYAFIFAKSTTGDFNFINNIVNNEYQFTDRFAEILADNVYIKDNVLNNYIASYGWHIKSNTISINSNNINNSVANFNLSRVFGVETKLISVENNNVNVLSSNSYPMFVRSMTTPDYVRFNNNVLQNLKFGYSIDSATELLCFATNNAVTRTNAGDIPKVANNVTSDYIDNNYIYPTS